MCDIWPRHVTIFFGRSDKIKLYTIRETLKFYYNPKNIKYIYAQITVNDFRAILRNKYYRKAPAFLSRLPLSILL